MEKVELSRDDWELTRKEVRNQRVQQLISLKVNTAILHMIENELKKFPEKTSEIAKNTV